MRLILLIGGSSVGKSALCKELRERHGFYIVKNGDDYFDEHLTQMASILKDRGIIDKLHPMRLDEILRFCVRQQLNLAKANLPLRDLKVHDLSKLEEIFIKAGFDADRSSELAGNLRLAKEIYNSHPALTPDVTLEKSFEEAFNVDNANETVVIDIVPEETPVRTQSLIQGVKKRAQSFGVQNGIDVTVETVLIYCPLKRLSDNIEARNVKAEQNQNIVDKRVGIDPLLLFASVATAENQETHDASRDLIMTSRKEIFEIIKKHEPEELVEEKYQALVGEGIFISNLNEYAYGFKFPEGVDTVMLHVPKTLNFDITLNNNEEKNPPQLAAELIEKLEHAQENQKNRELVTSSSATLFSQEKTIEDENTNVDAIRQPRALALQKLEEEFSQFILHADDDEYQNYISYLKNSSPEKYNERLIKALG